MNIGIVHYIIIFDVNSYDVVNESLNTLYQNLPNNKFDSNPIAIDINKTVNVCNVRYLYGDDINVYAKKNRIFVPK